MIKARSLVGLAVGYSPRKKNFENDSNQVDCLFF